MKLIIFVCSLLLVKVSAAQSISMESISSGGDSYSNSTAQLSFTVGEVMSETFTGGSNLICQGFQQTYITYWVGNGNTSWFIPSNWNGGPVPDSSVDIAILAGVPSNLTIDGNVFCRSITQKPGSVVIVGPGFSLKITGH